jgi:3-oxoacyl-[acyl-carrier-protein] synthase II
MRRVAITGVGLVTPLGVGVKETWGALCAGRSGVARITTFDASAYRCQIAAEVLGFDADALLTKRKAREMDRFAHFAWVAAGEAWRDAGMPERLEGEASARAGVILGSGMGGLASIERTLETLRTRGPGKVTPYFVPQVVANMAPGQLAMRFGLRGVNFCTTSACASGAHALGEAMRRVQRGEADVMLAGGAEATVTPLGLAGFDAMMAMSTRNDDPTRAVRPWDAARDGFVMGEGAGVLVLEAMDLALARGARVYAELAGYGATDDAHHLTHPAEGGEGAARAMRMALEDAGVSPDAVDHLNAHATGTPLGDRAEAEAVAAVFGAHAARVLVSATKSSTGHLLGAAGGIEAVFTALAVAEQTAPPTLNVDAIDPAVTFDLVRDTPRAARIDVALSNAFGFGGTNAALLFRRAREERRP